MLLNDDGLKWTALNNNESVLRPAVGEDRLMRDPSICQVPDGTFHFLVTCRIRKAMDILSKDSSARITDLASTLGFASSQPFAARFRRETGKTAFMSCRLLR